MTAVRMETSSKTPNLVGSTKDTYCCSIAESQGREIKVQDTVSHPPNQSEANDEDHESNFFKSAQWSPDGTSLLTSSADNTLRTFIIPPTLLESAYPITLTPYTAHNYPSSINCTTPYPFFTLSEPSTTLLLSALTDLPIRLTNTLSPTPAPVSTYSLVCPTTEAYLTPSSILWSEPGTHFMTGTDCLIARFDVSRNGDGPLTRLPTIPSKRHKMKGGGVGMRGIVSALSHQPGSSDSMLAAGTWTRWVGLYDGAGLGGTVATWSIAEAADVDAGIGGSGITQTLWSTCGRYLYIAERKCKGVLVYDVRVTGKLVAWLEGRVAETNQRLGVDVFEGPGGTEIWAGGTDGVVRVWEGTGKCEGGVPSTWHWKAHDDPITSTVVHSSGSVVATCSGQRSADFGPQYDDSSSSSGDSDDSDDETLDASVSLRTSSPARILTPPVCSSEPSISSRESTTSSTTSGSPDNSIKIWSL